MSTDRRHHQPHNKPQPSKATTPKRPRPVLTSQVVISAITVLLGQAVAFGLIPQATNAKVLSAVPIVVSALFIAFGAVHSAVAAFSSKKVTPSADPRAAVVQADGTTALEPLVPLSLAVQAVPNQLGAVDRSDDFADVVSNGRS